MSAAEYLVGNERRVGERRACDETPTASGRRGELVHRGNQAHIEIQLIEAQCAQEAAQDRIGHAVAAAQLLLNELRQARAAATAARQAARNATSIVSGEPS